MATGDIKIVYAADAQLTITLAALPTDASLLTGREATSVDNTTNKYDDYAISGKITVGTNPTANTRIEIWAVAPINDTPTWPDVFDGTDSAETITSAGIKKALKLIAVLDVDATTSDRTYPFILTSLASLFGGICPNYFTVFVTHNTGVNFNSTAGNHEISAMGIYYNVST